MDCLTMLANYRTECLLSASKRQRDLAVRRGQRPTPVSAGPNQTLLREGSQHPGAVAEGTSAGHLNTELGRSSRPRSRRSWTRSAFGRSRRTRPVAAGCLLTTRTS
jgi:hypothetical protein